MTQRSRGSRRARLVGLALVALFAVGTAACGSRVDVAGSGGGGVDDTAPGGEGGGGEAPSADASEIGTIDNPCSDEAPEGAAPTDTPGVTDDTIRIGVISDK